MTRSAITPPMIRPTASAAVIRPQAAGPPRCSRATTGPSTSNAPYQAASTTLYWIVVAHSQRREANADHPSRSSRSTLGDCVRTAPGARMASSSGTVPNMPIPQVASAQPGPVAATNTPAIPAPAICAAFIASLLMALASWSRRSGTSRGSSAWEAG